MKGQNLYYNGNSTAQVINDALARVIQMKGEKQGNAERKTCER